MLGGILLIIPTALLLTVTPQSVYQRVHREGYSRTQVEVTGQSSTLGDTSQSVIPVWYNPEARLRFGITLFDERIVSAEPYHGLPSRTRVAVFVVVNLALVIAVIVLLRWPDY